MPKSMTTRREFVKRASAIPVVGLWLESVASSESPRRIASGNSGIQGLRQLCLDRLSDRYGQACFHQANRRLDHELAILDRLGQIDEFLAVAELAGFCDEKGVPMKLTGSGCSSIITYLLGFSDVDPLRHQLFFERFRDPDGRWSPPFMFEVGRKHKERIAPIVFEHNEGFRDCEVDPVCLVVLDWDPSVVAERLQREYRCTVDLGRAPYDDNQVFRLIRSGDTEGLSSFHHFDGLRCLLPRLRPTTIEDLAAVVTLYRLSVTHGHLMERYIQRAGEAQFPGSDNPDILEALSETRGLILYQEQIMMLLDRIGGICPADGFDFIKAVFRKKAATVAEYRAKFLRTAVGNKTDKETVGRLFDQITEAAGYAFCKANSVAEAMTTYKAAYLKAYYRPEVENVLEGVRLRP